jgi:hypothetical protein
MFDFYFETEPYTWTGVGAALDVIFGLNYTANDISYKWLHGCSYDAINQIGYLYPDLTPEEILQTHFMNKEDRKNIGFVHRIWKDENNPTLIANKWRPVKYVNDDWLDFQLTLSSLATEYENTLADQIKHHASIIEASNLSTTDKINRLKILKKEVVELLNGISFTIYSPKVIKSQIEYFIKIGIEFAKQMDYLHSESPALSRNMMHNLIRHSSI